jgi:hypothetical protein
MKRQWQIRRQFQTTADTARRWDQVYQMLLQWSQSTESTTKPDLSTPLHPPSEVTYDKRNLCSRIDGSPDAGPNH